jgi:hypothetical protein
VAQLAELAHERRLAALEVADEVPAKGVAVALVLGAEVLGAVLADDLHAGLGQCGHVLQRDVLRRGDDGHVRPDLFPDVLVALADLSR